MKKTAVLLAATMLFACAGNMKVGGLTKSQAAKMSPVEITQYYEAQNAKLKEKILFNYGGDAYAAADSILNQMNAELNAMSRQKITRSGYDLKLKEVVQKYNQRIAAAIEQAKFINE